VKPPAGEPSLGIGVFHQDICVSYGNKVNVSVMNICVYSKFWALCLYGVVGRGPANLSI
jgi:hypothetical protein